MSLPLAREALIQQRAVSADAAGIVVVVPGQMGWRLARGAWDSEVMPENYFDERIAKSPTGTGRKDVTTTPELDSAPVIAAVAADQQLRAFVSDGRIQTMPARQARRRLLLDTIAQAFEPGMRYPERHVSMFLAAIHPDHAALRRYLIDEGFLSRADGQYWRTGGTVPSAPAHEPGT